MPFFFIKRNAAKMKHFYILLPSRLFLRYLCTITPIFYLHKFHVMVHSPACKNCTYGRYAGHEHAHTQTHKYMYTALPTRPHIWQVRQSGTCTHTDTQVHVHSPAYIQDCTYGWYTGQGHAHTDTQVHVHVHSPAYKTAHMAGTPVRNMHTHTDTQVLVHSPAYKTAYMAGTPVRDMHTQTQQYMYTALPTRPHIWQV